MFARSAAEMVGEGKEEKEKALLLLLLRGIRLLLLFPGKKNLIFSRALSKHENDWIYSVLLSGSFLWLYGKLRAIKMPRRDGNGIHSADEKKNGLPPQKKKRRKRRMKAWNAFPKHFFLKKVPYKFHGRPTAHFPTPKKGFLMTILWNWTELRGPTVKAFLPAERRSWNCRCYWGEQLAASIYHSFIFI